MDPKRIIIGSDHGGWELKDFLGRRLSAKGWSVEDVGCEGPTSVDYPDYAIRLCHRLKQEEIPRGMLICGTGIGMCIAANKVPGIRAALCQEAYSAQMARAHNDANVLCFGARVIGPELAWSVLSAFLDTEFEQGRHQQRLSKIAVMENDRDLAKP
jgi:ribose 5-phosphate isomerase B